MGKLMLLGARKFLDMPKGTFYIAFWMNTAKECMSIVERFKLNPLELVDLRKLHIYGNNGGSMAFSKEEEDFTFFYDANVVGDACPNTTVYLVLDDSFIPEVAQYTEDETCFHCKTNTEIIEKGLTLTRDQVFKIREEFLMEFDNEDNISDTSNYWARERLNKNQHNSLLLNLCLEAFLQTK